MKTILSQLVQIFTECISFFGAAVIKFHALSGFSFNHRNLWSHSSGGWKSKIKMLSRAGSFPGLWGDSVPRFSSPGGLLVT